MARERSELPLAAGEQAAWSGRLVRSFVRVGVVRSPAGDHLSKKT